MKFTTTIVAALSGLLVSAAPAVEPVEPSMPTLPHNQPFALRIWAPHSRFHGIPLDVAGDINAGVNLLQIAKYPQYPQNQFVMEAYMPTGGLNANVYKGYLRYKGYGGNLHLYAGFDKRQRGIKVFEMVNSPGNPNPTRFHNTIDFTSGGRGFMTIQGHDSFFLCNTRKTDGTVVVALNWDNTYKAGWQGCEKVSVYQTAN